MHGRPPYPLVPPLSRPSLPANSSVQSVCVWPDTQLAMTRRCCSLARATVVSPAVVALRETATPRQRAVHICIISPPTSSPLSHSRCGRGGGSGLRAVRRQRLPPFVGVDGPGRAGDGQRRPPIATFILLIYQCFCGVFIIYATLGEVSEFRKIGRSWENCG